MKIHATFINRKYDPEEVEMVHAWDEYAVDENHEGFIASRQAELESLGDDLLNSVTVVIEVPTDDIKVIRRILTDGHQVAGRLIADEGVR